MAAVDLVEPGPPVTALDVHRIDEPEQSDLSHLVDLLDAGERERLRRFRQQSDRRRYLAAHAGLRILLSERLSLTPGTVRLGRAACPICGDDHGRPISLDDPRGTAFSIAHTDGLVLLAVADGAVGVDVEPGGGPDLREDLDGTLHPHERREIDRLPPAERPRALLSCWVRTEAYLKALGTGLGLDPATVAVGPAGTGGLVSEIDGWNILDLDVGVTHVAALALAGGVADAFPSPVVVPLVLP